MKRRMKVKSLCKCGCGHKPKPDQTFIFGHKAPFIKGLRPQLCECGCGELAGPGIKFLQGHGARTERLKKLHKDLLEQDIERICEKCGKKFMGRCSRKYCNDPCKTEFTSDRAKGLEFVIMRGEVAKTRNEFKQLVKDNPIAAEKLYNQLIEEEGEEFKNLALDGILEEALSQESTQKDIERIKRYLGDKK